MPIGERHLSTSWPEFMRNMLDRLANWLGETHLSWSTGLWGLAILITGLALSNLLVVVVLVRLPDTYFIDPAPSSFLAARHPLVAWTLRILKNLSGLVTILLGIVLSLPGVPGPGLLLMLIGVMLLEFPGKRRLERRIVAMPKLLRAINRLRDYFGKPPLRLEA